MIKELWICEKQTGRILLQRSYRGIESSQSLVNGFLQAIYGLYQYAESELASVEGGKGLESLNMVGMRWIYEEKKGLILIAATDKDADLEMLKEQINLIADSFINRFGSPFEALYGGGIDKYLASDFNSFFSELDTIINQWEQMKNVADAAKRMDLLDVIQNIIQRFQSFPNFSDLIQGGELDVIGQAFESSGDWDPSFLMSIDIPIIKEKIKNVFHYIKDFYMQSNSEQFPSLLSKYVYPYIKNDWERIKEVELDDIFIYTLL